MDDHFRQQLRTHIDAEVLGDPNPPGVIVAGARVACRCGTLIDAAENTQWIFSGTPGSLNGYGVYYTVTLCSTCRNDREFLEQGRGICVQCKAPRALIKPGKMSTGFEFVRGRHYHLVDCPHCNPSATASEVLEHAVFCRENKVVTQKDFDLVQDIEQKSLRAAAARERLRQDINKSWNRNDHT